MSGEAYPRQGDYDNSAAYREAVDRWHDADPYRWHWSRHVALDGGTEWRGESAYHSATVTRQTTGWQACVPTSGDDQRSGYYAGHDAARAWAERYGRPRARRTRKR